LLLSTLLHRRMALNSGFEQMRRRAPADGEISVRQQAITYGCASPIMVQGAALAIK
jgi:hypothetical protein